MIQSSMKSPGSLQAGDWSLHGVASKGTHSPSQKDVTV